MARPKPKRSSAKKAAPEKKPRSKAPVFSLRGDPEWFDWVKELAGHTRLTMATLIDKALVDYARSTAFSKVAPPRIAERTK